MLLSRAWYFFLSVLMGVALYVSYVAVGQYNRRNQVAMTEGLASDSQVVRWAMQIDARRRLDALLPAAVDKEVQESLVAATTSRDKVLPKWRDDARRGLDAFNQKLPADLKYDSLFAVDRDGRVLAQVGFDQANAYDDFELGGYPAVNDALHGYLRDDTWVLGGRIYRVSARSVEYDVTQPPAGAVVALRLVDARFAQEISNLTRTNVAFYAAGIRVASAVPKDTDGIDARVLDQLTAELPGVETDKTYHESGRTGIRLLDKDNLGAIFARFEGDAWEQRAGFAVARARVSIAGPFGFIGTADDKDRASAPWATLALMVILFGAAGVGLTLLEHTLPLREMKRQAERLRNGGIDLLQLARFRGAYRPIATDLNSGIERVAEKGGAPRKLADVEKIIGPLPAQPAMSAFAFPGPESGGALAPASPVSPPPFVPPGNRGAGAPSGPALVPPTSSKPGFGGASGTGSGPAVRAERHAGASGGFAAAEVPSRPGFAGRPPPMQGVHGMIAPSGAGSVAPQAGANAANAGIYAASARAIAAPQPVPSVPDESGRTPLSPPRSGKMSAAQSGPHAMAAHASVPVAPPSGPPKPPPAPPARERISRPQVPPPQVPSRSGPAQGAPPPVPAQRPPNPPSGSSQAGPLPRSPVPSLERPETNPTTVGPLSPEARALLQEAKEDRRDLDRPADRERADDEPATIVGSAPQELLAKAGSAFGSIGAERPSAEEAEWRIVYEDFIRTKKQCGESTEGLTFAKFQHTLRKNRDALIQRHGCKRVRFSVYVKEGRASLKATPVKD